MMTLLAGLGGAIAVLGVVLVVVGLRGTTPAPAGTPQRRLPKAGRRGLQAESQRRTLQIRGGVAAVSAVLVLLFTSWPIAALAAAAAVFGLPALLSGRNTGADRIERLEALDEWTRRLIGLIASGQGLEHMLERSAAVAPGAIAAEVGALAARLRSRLRTEDALRAFADDIDDPVADLIVGALLITASRRGAGLRPVLEGLAKTVAEEVAMRRSIEADRAKPRRAARNMVLITAGFVSIGLLLWREYFSAFDGVFGQIALATAVGVFAGSYLWMYRLSLPEPAVRFLSPTRVPGAAQ